jgi:cytochrome d ubiquinol oxidase subunit I
MRNPAAFSQCLHMTLAAYAAVGFCVAGIHAAKLLRDRENAFHRRALAIAFGVGAVASVAQPLSGDVLARMTARTQPVKLAAMEGQFATQRRAPLRLGGLPDTAARTTRGALEIPGGLSFLAFHDVDAEVQGLTAFSEDLWPPVSVVHLAFQVMVGAGTLLAALSVWGGWLAFRRRLFASRPFLRALVLASPLGLLAIEAGWAVTEVGRQPWIVQGVLRTADAVTPMPGLVVPFLLFTGLYLFLAAVVLWLLARQVAASPAGR